MSYKHDNTSRSLVCIGVVASAHGIRGEVTIKTFTESPESLSTYEIYDANGNSLDIIIKGKKKAGVICRVNDTSDRNAAEDMIGTELFIKRSSMPDISDDEFYYTDIIDLEVRNANQQPIGKVVSMNNFGAGDIIEILFLKSGKKEMLSFNKNTVRVINITSGYIIIEFPDEL